jgi:hypothetical protein
LGSHDRFGCALARTYDPSVTRQTTTPPRPIVPGDIVAAFSDELGEWTAAQVTDLDPNWPCAGVLDLDWSGPEPNSIEDLGDLIQLRLSHHAHTGQLSHCNYEWLLPRNCNVVGNVPLLHDGKSNSYSSGWRLGDQLARQRLWDRGERISGHQGEREFFGAEIMKLVSASDEFLHLWKVSITEIDSLDCDHVVALFPNLTRLSLSGNLGTLANVSSLNRLGSLKSLYISDLFGMTRLDCLRVSAAPNLEMLALHSVPAEYAAAMKKTWDGREHISAARCRKAVAHYKATRRAVLEALDETAGEENGARFFELGREYGEAFNQLDGP